MIINFQFWQLCWLESEVLISGKSFVTFNSYLIIILRFLNFSKKSMENSLFKNIFGHNFCICQPIFKILLHTLQQMQF